MKIEKYKSLTSGLSSVSLNFQPKAVVTLVKMAHGIAHSQFVIQKILPVPF